MQMFWGCGKVVLTDKGNCEQGGWNAWSSLNTDRHNSIYHSKVTGLLYLWICDRLDQRKLKRQNEQLYKIEFTNFITMETCIKWVIESWCKIKRMWKKLYIILSNNYLMERRDTNVSSQVNRYCHSLVQQAV